MQWMECDRRKRSMHCLVAQTLDRMKVQMQL